MNLDRLALQLELTTGFTDRQTLATQMAEELDQDQLARIARLLGHENKNVRLGVIEILRAAGFRPALKFLAAVTLQRDGDERVFAARAVTELVRADDPEDRKLARALCARWRAVDDEFLATHTDELARLFNLETSAVVRSEHASKPATRQPNLAVVPPSPAPAISPNPIEGIISPHRDVRQQAIARTAAQLEHPERAFAEALLCTRHKGARVDLVHALERLGPRPISNVLEDILYQADADLAALVLRSLRRGIPQLSPERKASVRAQLLAVRPRLVEHELARAAMDDCLVLADR